MLYWLPRFAFLMLVIAAVAFGFIQVSSDDVANTMIVVILGLGLFSLTLHVFPPERY